MKKKRIGYLYEKKSKGEKMPRTVCFDYPMACIAEAAGIDIINVGDSIANIMFGYENTLSAKLDIMIEHAKGVRKGAPSAFIMGDMPFLSYQVSKSDTIKNAGRYLQEAGMDCVKIEGNMEIVDTIKFLKNASIPVIGHTGLIPQSINAMGGYKTQGKDAKSAESLIETALAFEDAGVIAITLECVPIEVAKIIYERVKVPILGTGSGPYSDSPMINLYDLLGFVDITPRFAKRYANLKELAIEATTKFVNEVKNNIYPGPEESYNMLEGEYEKLVKSLKRNIFKD